MWSTLRLLWQVRQGRRTAVAAIRPRVEDTRYRLNGIPDSAWLQPYMVGFLMMLITLAARRRYELDDGQALSLVQSEAWADITGMKSEMIGEEALLLSSARQQDFERGCQNAETFANAAFDDFTAPGIASGDESAMPPGVENGASPEEYVARGAREAELTRMWMLCFDTYLGVIPQL